MTLPPVPSNVAQYISEAANGTGLPESVVAAQNYTESGYGTNEGPSSAGAEGPWQFLPSTFSGIMGNVNGITDWAISTQAYIKYMKQLLQEENGNVRNALAAYNAGPGNLQAGYGYADSILTMAGTNSSIQVTSATASNAGSSAVGGIFSWPGDITGFFGDANSFVTRLAWIVQPGSWLRIGSFFLALILIIGAVAVFTKADQNFSIRPVPVPI